MTPSKLLTSYNTNYKARIIKDKSQTDPNLESVELIPNVIKNINRAILVVDKTKKQIRSFTLFDKSGNVFAYTIQKFLTDVPVTTSDFTFEAAKFPGVEVIDMR
jgi:outer membrane lipoprotein-sorting protein